MADILLYDEGIIFDADDPDFDHREEDDAKVARKGEREKEWGGREGGREEGRGASCKEHWVRLLRPLFKVVLQVMSAFAASCLSEPPCDFRHELFILSQPSLSLFTAPLPCLKESNTGSIRFRSYSLRPPRVSPSPWPAGINGSSGPVWELP
ncbi:hypothetical protein E2C01_054352 [Portunus trituberculatus]|uniref:Uncharacterized protein n=1 Tax=Portunus trituberculatus TaxID=210409 RepID=A0A5B7GJL4_PORTR|nr:hypothetical protein [Portunus trituberculatus]